MLEFLVQVFGANYVADVGKMCLALLCGLIVGLERTYRGKPAGVRTNMLICLGACLFMIVSEHVSRTARDAGYLNSDPARIAAQVVTGIGFLGAGTIMRNRGLITGLTSASSIWVIASIGLACGAGMGAIALTGSVFIVGTVEGFGFVVRRIRVERFRYLNISVVIKKEATVNAIRKRLRKLGITYAKESTEVVLGELHYHAEVYARGLRDQEIEDKLLAIPGVRQVTALAQLVE